MKETVVIRKEPTKSDLVRLMKVAADTVQEMARMDGALGADAISLLYIDRLYKAIVAGQVKQK